MPPSSDVDKLLDQAARDEHRDHVYALERRIQELRADLTHEQTKTKKLQGDLSTALAQVEFANATYDPVRRYNIGTLKKGRRTKNVCWFLWSDWHLEEFVHAEVNGVEHNLQTAEKRNRRILHGGLEIAEAQRTYYPFDEVGIWIGGDIINGAIHEESEETNFLGPGEAILKAQDMLLAAIENVVSRLSPKKVWIVCNYGNHGRTVKKKRISTGYLHSWEWLAYNQMARLLQSDKRFEFIICKFATIQIDVQGVPCRFTHGDDIRYVGGVGGVMIPFRKKVSEWDKRKQASLTVSGHFHQFFCDTRTVLNGSTIGLNAYGLSCGFSPEPPSQTIMITNSKRGLIECSRIFADSAGV